MKPILRTHLQTLDNGARVEHVFRPSHIPDMPYHEYTAHYEVVTATGFPLLYRFETFKAAVLVAIHADCSRFGHVKGETRSTYGNATTVTRCAICNHQESAAIASHWTR
jgi:hypothetical protein